jgi:hypothetical protein
MAPNAIPKTFNKSLPSVCVHIVARQQLGRHFPAAKNTCNNRIILGRAVFCTVRVLSKARLCVYLRITLSSLGNDSMYTFPRQRRIVGDGFYATHVVQRKVGD